MSDPYTRDKVTAAEVLMACETLLLAGFTEEALTILADSRVGAIMIAKTGFKPLLDNAGPTWREIIAEALRTFADRHHDSVEGQRLALADHILAALRKSARPDPLELGHGR